MKHKIARCVIGAVLLIFLAFGCDVGMGLTETPDSGTTTADDGNTGGSGTGTVLDVIRKYGTISTDETWNDGYIYYISSDLAVECTVTIEPGTIIKFGNDVAMRVRNGGKIIAVGTSTKRIHFTGRYDDIGGDSANSDRLPQKQDWDAIKIYEPDSVFQFCTFQYGEDTLEVVQSNTKVTATDNIFTNNYYGFCGRYAPSPDSVVERNRFYLNTYPLIIDPKLSLGDTNYFTSEDGVQKNSTHRIGFYMMGGVQIDESVTLSETEIPFWGGSGIVISNNSVLTLNPGVVIVMSPTTIIQVETNSDIVLSSGSVITSTLDDSLSGAPSSSIDSSYYWEGIRDGYGSSATYRTNLSGVFFSNN